MKTVEKRPNDEIRLADDPRLVQRATSKPVSKNTFFETTRILLFTEQQRNASQPIELKLSKIIKLFAQQTLP